MAETYHNAGEDTGEVLARIRQELVGTDPADFDTAMVALVYPLVSTSMQWEEEHPGSQAAHVPLPDELYTGRGRDNLVGVAMRLLKDGSVRVFSYSEWFQRADGWKVSGMLVQEGNIKPDGDS